ncbi:NAD(P)-binding domain-containing protein [Flavobacterium sp. B17]|uniref:NAD(P)-binding domain-containing protein n=1 Tax=Flavobacterium sp. B17 TaxID=95618 RepID=UPI00034B1584|nr:NAD(P)-binding domain-containing protein [Flavobacterium sp. B17]
MQIVIIGSGNVAYHLAKAFVLNKIPLAQIFGRNEKELNKISEELKIPFSTEKLQPADLYIICVSDNSVEEFPELLPQKTVWWLILPDRCPKKF